MSDEPRVRYVFYGRSEDQALVLFAGPAIHIRYPFIDLVCRSFQKHRDAGSRQLCQAAQSYWLDTRHPSRGGYGLARNSTSTTSVTVPTPRR